MTSDVNTSYIHYDPERVDYSLTESELHQLTTCASNHWKDFAIACGAVGLPCLMNAIGEASRQATFNPTLSFVLNLVFGVLGMVLATAFGIAWRKSSGSLDELVRRLRNKPKIPFVPKMADIGMLSQSTEETVP